MQSAIANNLRHSLSCQLRNKCLRMTKNGILPSVERTAHTCSSLMKLMQSHQQQCPPLPHCHRCFHSLSFGWFHESHGQCKRGGFISRTGKPPQPQHGKPILDQSLAEVEASPPKDEGLYDAKIWGISILLQGCGLQSLYLAKFPLKFHEFNVCIAQKHQWRIQVFSHMTASQ